MSLPTYKIYGLDRRKLKKELSNLKSYVKGFWYFHNVEKDMEMFYGNGQSHVMSDVDAIKHFNDVNLKIKEIEDRLSILYNNESA